MHDGSVIQLHKLEEDYDPTDRMGALHRLEWARQKNEFITGLVYYDDSRANLAEVSNIGQTPLAQLPDEKIRPSREALAEVMNSFI
jgi:2-oxoglutarate ferredoxin oxidoreductase subunit beta